MGYRYLKVPIKRINDASISSKNFVNFGPVTPQLPELICERLVLHGQKTGVFTRISQDILDRFSQSLHHIVGIELQMINLTFFSDILKDVAMATNLVARMGQNYLPPICTYRSLIPKRNGISLPQCAR